MSWREQFPIFQHHPQLVYLDSAATAHKPYSVIEALNHFYSVDYATVHRSAYRSSIRATEKYHAAREAVRQFLHAETAEEIVFTRGTTDSINLIARAFPFAAGDEILISEMEHHSNIVPWQMAAERTKAVLRWIPANKEGILNWQPYINSKTKLIALAHVSNVTGVIHPIAQIAQAAKAVGACLVIDGAQAAPHLPIDVVQLGCDFYAFSGHKCYGPTGIGILYGRKERLEALPPLYGGGDMIETVAMENTSYQKPPLRFEAGTPIIASAIGLEAALRFIEGCGREEIAKHERSLREEAEHALAAIPGLQILGRSPQKGAIVTFHMAGIHP
ncbi:MAG: cysteine desulfurase, partial [Chlamydiia bacterium]|nr:cysteine desulfurase [Chlamydiia bacterium]